MTKYIVDNVTNQTITGNLRIDGGLKITDGTYSVSTYKALLTQTATFSGTSIGGFGGFYGLIIGEEYTIDDYQSGDDFSNIANVVSGIINETGCVFVATGELPAIWSNGSQLTSSGNLVVSVLTNNLGFDIQWSTFESIYFGLKSNTGPLYNSFPRNYVSVQSSQNSPFFGTPTQLWQYVGVGSLIGDKDESVYLAMWNFETMESVPNYLHYTPIEISFKQSLDTTPIGITGSTYSTFPFGNVSIDLYAGENIVETIYANDTSTVNNLSELVILLNSDEVISYLGTFSNVSNNIHLSTTINIKNQFSPDNTFGFVIFSD